MTQRQPRFRDDGYLAWLRQQPCACGCRQPPPCDAAHLRAGDFASGKPACTGAQIKPDDYWAMPLKHAHHMAQHAYGSEIEWWRQHGVEPFSRALRYYGRYLQSTGLPFMSISEIKAEIERRRLNQKVRKRTTIKPRLPREQRTKIKGRSTWGQRKLRSRK
jgi:hypothetical protein